MAGQGCAYEPIRKRAEAACKHPAAHFFGVDPTNVQPAGLDFVTSVENLWFFTVSGWSFASGFSGGGRGAGARVVGEPLLRVGAEHGL